MSIQGLGGLPEYLRLLTTYPAPDAAMASLVAGPLAGVAAAAARFWLLDGDELVHVGGHGYTPDEIDRYAILAPDLPFRAWDCLREQRIITTPSDAPRAPALEAVDSPFRTAMLRRRSIECVVRAPMARDGIPVGVVAVALTGPWPDEDEPRAGHLTGLASALALWSAVPASGAAAAAADTRTRARSAALVFSERERDILRLVEARVPTSAIAHRLQVSESTVKAELLDAMRALSTNDRVVAAARARALGLLD